MSECSGPDCPICAAERASASGGGEFHQAIEEMRQGFETLAAAGKDIADSAQQLGEALGQILPSPEEKAQEERRILGKKRDGAFTRRKAKPSNKAAEKAARRRSRK